MLYFYKFIQLQSININLTSKVLSYWLWKILPSKHSCVVSMYGDRKYAPKPSWLGAETGVYGVSRIWREMYLGLAAFGPSNLILLSHYTSYCWSIIMDPPFTDEQPHDNWKTRWESSPIVVKPCKVPHDITVVPEVLSSVVLWTTWDGTLWEQHINLSLPCDVVWWKILEGFILPC